MNRLMTAALVLLSLPAAAAAQSEAMMIHHAPVRKDLKLTPAQKAGVDKALARYEAADEARSAEYQKKYDQARKDYEAAVARGEAEPGAVYPLRVTPIGDLVDGLAADLGKVLTRAQLKRLEEIDLQRMRVRALLREKYQKKLNLDPELVTLIRQDIDESELAIGAVFDAHQAGIQAGTVPLGGAAGEKAMRLADGKADEIRARMEMTVLKRLTKKQREQLKKMQGEPFPRPDPEPKTKAKT